MTTQANQLLTFIRTKQFFQLRLKAEVPEVTPTRLTTKDLLKYPAPGLLDNLVKSGELLITTGKGWDGQPISLYSVTKGGTVDFSLIEKRDIPTDDLTATMIKHLQNVLLLEAAESTDYFNVFLRHKNARIDLFVTVDKFGKRFHSPVTSFHRTHRPNLLLYGQPTASLDIAQSQPTVLAKILHKALGENEFSTWIDQGRDIYEMLQGKAGLDCRDAAKKKFFEIAFAPASNQLADIFGDAPWIRWINEFKQTDIPQNPHGKHKRHSNLAWLLQNTESAMMRSVWHAMANAGIPFLSVHDEVIIQASKIDRAEAVFNQVLAKHLQTFKISRKEKSQDDIITQMNNHDTIEPRSLISPYFKPKEIAEIVSSLWDLNFPDVTIPKTPIRLDLCTLISDPEEFYKSHLSICERNNGNRTFRPYFDRLKIFFEIITTPKST
ncbi:MAG TPA: hypothetical protein VNI52_03040 [Sphingobacteriaceae bacterium]|nr:hypothetical protein [Sphingobacteriaceae bacterium]